MEILFGIGGFLAMISLLVMILAMFESSNRIFVIGMLGLIFSGVIAINAYAEIRDDAAEAKADLERQTHYTTGQVINVRQVLTWKEKANSSCSRLVYLTSTPSVVQQDCYIYIGTSALLTPSPKVGDWLTIKFRSPKNDEVYSQVLEVASFADRQPKLSPPAD